MKTGLPWAWGASGKHPVVSDFIRIGQDTQALRTFSRWVDDGFGRLAASREFHSWRFLSRGEGADGLSCGLVRDSLDRAGRPFPLLVVGSGRLEGWDRVWERLPIALDVLWARIEFICSKRASDLSELKGDINALPAPALNDAGQATGRYSGETAPEIEGGGMCSVVLTGSDDHMEEVVRRLGGIRARLSMTPEAVFMGGTAARSFLVAFARSLSGDDFVRLWTMERQDV